MSEKSFLAREPRLRSENTYLISPQDLTNRRLKRSNVAKPTPRRPSPYPPVVKKKPAKMVTRSPPAKPPKANRPTLMDNDSDMPGGLQLALIAPTDPQAELRVAYLQVLRPFRLHFLQWIRSRL